MRPAYAVKGGKLAQTLKFPLLRSSFGGQRSIQLNYGCVGGDLADRLAQRKAGLSKAQRGKGHTFELVSGPPVRSVLRDRLVVRFAG